jgi:phospholipase/carboxylesterase
MNKIQTDLIYRHLEPQKKVGNASPAIILLHGRGADENDLLGLSPHLDERLAIFSVRAPYPFEYGGFTYFQLNEDGTAEPKMFMESYKRMLKFAEGVSSLPEVNATKVFLMGFSMGTIMAYALALTRPEKFAGVIAQSGFVRDHPDLPFVWHKLGKCSFIITHGVDDMVIPVRLARATRDKFSESNADFVYKEYPMGHQISDESLADVCNWLERRLE